MIPTEKLKEIASKLDDGPVKIMINQLADQITEQDLISKMDLILPFMTNKALDVKK